MFLQKSAEVGGIPKKSPLVMQILADVLDMPVKVTESSQAVALGAAIFGAVASGYYENIHAAQDKMSSKFLITYYPEKSRVKLYNSIYKLYIEFGSITEDLLRKL